MGRKYFYIILLLIASCKYKETTTEATPEEAQTPVTVTSISQSPMEEFIELNATSAYLLKNYVKANATGYLRSAQVMPGQFVKSGQVLFTIKTKEAESIGNAVNMLDTSFKFSGTNSIRAGADGFISQLNHQSGDYVQDGEQLAVISDQNSFVFLLDLPFELRKDVSVGKQLEVNLPDGEKIPGSITSFMPTVDAASQTQSIVIKVLAPHTIPENLIAKIKIPTNTISTAVSLPVSAVLSDETQSAFWVMKMIDSTTAVKVKVKKGMQTKTAIQILSPVFSTEDKFVLTGNYGLGDTAKVRITQPE